MQSTHSRVVKEPSIAQKTGIRNSVRTERARQKVRKMKNKKDHTHKAIENNHGLELTRLKVNCKASYLR